jgi:hypothetical protein
MSSVNMNVPHIDDVPSKSRYPRVLLVTMVKVNLEDTGNLLIRSEFSNWPKDRLAQIHPSGDLGGTGEFCGRCYRLQACDRVFGRVFRWLRGAVSEIVAQEAIDEESHVKRTGLVGRWGTVIKKHLGEALICSGVWEVIFRIRLSRSMCMFIKDFKPDLVYCSGYSLGFATLPLLIAKRFNTPICFQTTDDWPSYMYRSSPVGWLLRRRARQLVTKAKVRMAFGEKMRREYESRYGVRFEAMYHLDDPYRFAKEVNNDDMPLRIVYTGSLGLRRYEAIQDLLDVVRSIQDGIQPIQIVLYSSGLPKDFPHLLLDAPEVVIRPLPTHQQMPRTLVAASVLFLPESFTVAPELLEYAISSKAHLYMMSGRPILAYGPAYSGTIGYANDYGWAAVVTERKQNALKRALLKLLKDSMYSGDLSRNAHTCVTSNHELLTGQERFRKMLANSVLSLVDTRH